MILNKYNYYNTKIIYDIVNDAISYKCIKIETTVHSFSQMASVRV